MRTLRAFYISPFQRHCRSLGLSDSISHKRSLGSRIGIRHCPWRCLISLNHCLSAAVQTEPETIPSACKRLEQDKSRNTKSNMQQKITSSASQDIRQLGDLLVATIVHGSTRKFAAVCTNHAHCRVPPAKWSLQPMYTGLIRCRHRFNLARSRSDTKTPKIKYEETEGLEPDRW